MFHLGSHWSNPSIQIVSAAHPRVRPKLFNEALIKPWMPPYVPGTGWDSWLDNFEVHPPRITWSIYQIPIYQILFRKYIISILNKSNQEIQNFYLGLKLQITSWSSITNSKFSYLHPESQCQIRNEKLQSRIKIPMLNLTIQGFNPVF